VSEVKDLELGFCSLHHEKEMEGSLQQTLERLFASQEKTNAKI
jgi:hypothetical protein